MEKFDKYDEWYSKWKSLINMKNDIPNGKVW